MIVCSTVEVDLERKANHLSDHQSRQEKEKKEDVTGASVAEAGQGSGPDHITLGGVNVIAKDFAEIFQGCTFVDRILYCLPNDIGELDSESVDNFYNLLMSQLSGKMDKEITDIAKRSLHLPLNKCLEGTIERIMENGNPYIVDDDSEKTMRQATRALTNIFRGLQGRDSSILLPIFLEIFPPFRKFRDYLELLPEHHVLAQIIRSVRRAMIDVFKAIVDNNRGDVLGPVMSIFYPLTEGYSMKHDSELLPLFSQVLKQGPAMMSDIISRICSAVIPVSVEVLQDNVHKIEFCTNFCTLLEDLWLAGFNYFFKEMGQWVQMMSCTFWASKHMNPEIACNGSNILVGVVNTLQGMDLSRLDESYYLGLVYDVFRGFSRHQDNSVFVLYVKLAFLSLKLFRRTNQAGDGLEKTISKAFRDSCYDVPENERDDLVSKVMTCEDLDALEDILRSFFFAGNRLADYLKG